MRLSMCLNVDTILGPKEKALTYFGGLHDQPKRRRIFIWTSCDIAISTLNVKLQITTLVFMTTNQMRILLTISWFCKHIRESHHIQQGFSFARVQSQVCTWALSQGIHSFLSLQHPGFSPFCLGRRVLVLTKKASIEDPTNIALKIQNEQKESQVDTKDCLQLLFTNLVFQRSDYVLGLSTWLKDFHILNLSFHKCSVVTMLPDFQGLDYKVPFSRNEDESPYKK